MKYFYANLCYYLCCYYARYANKAKLNYETYIECTMVDETYTQMSLRVLLTREALVYDNQLMIFHLIYYLVIYNMVESLNIIMQEDL